MDIVKEFLPDPKAIVQLPAGEAFINNPEWGTVRIRVRPPLSKVWEFGFEETKALVGSMYQQQPHLSQESQCVLDLAIKEHNQTGKPVKMSLLTAKLGITSRRRILQIVDELEQTLLARFQRLEERGQPLVMIPCTTKRA